MIGNITKNGCIFFILAFALGGPYAYADFLIQSQLSQKDQKSSFVTAYVTKQKMRMSRKRKNQKNMEIIIRADLNKIWTYKKGESKFIEISNDDQSLGGLIPKEMKGNKMAQSLFSLISKSKPLRPVKTRYRKINKRGSVDGILCEWYRGYQGKKWVQSVCHAEIEDLGISQAEFNELKAYYKSFSKMNFLGISVDRYSGSVFIPKGKATLPINSIQRENGKRTSSSKIIKYKSIKKRPHSDFEIPQGMQRESLLTTKR